MLYISDPLPRRQHMDGMNKAQHAKLGLIIQREQILDHQPTSPITRLALELESLGYIVERKLPGHRSVYASTDAGRAAHAAGPVG
jgi:hypothetical protein